MSGFEITAKQKYAYKTGRGWHPDTVPHVLANALQAQFAARLKAEFEKEHHEGSAEASHLSGSGNRIVNWYQCVVCRHGDFDPCHMWTDADWLAEADRRLKQNRED